MSVPLTCLVTRYLTSDFTHVKHGCLACEGGTHYYFIAHFYPLLPFCRSTSVSSLRADMAADATSFKTQLSEC